MGLKFLAFACVGLRCVMRFFALFAVAAAAGASKPAGASKDCPTVQASALVTQTYSLFKDVSVFVAGAVYDKGLEVAGPQNKKKFDDGVDKAWAFYEEHTLQFKPQIAQVVVMKDQAYEAALKGYDQVSEVVFAAMEDANGSLNKSLRPVFMMAPQHKKLLLAPGLFDKFVLLVWLVFALFVARLILKFAVQVVFFFVFFPCRLCCASRKNSKSKSRGNFQGQPKANGKSNGNANGKPQSGKKK